MSVTIVGQQRVQKPRKAHACFLCSVVISAGEAHDRWCCVGEGSISRLRVHDACKSYAHDRIDSWTNGDGVEDNAVETDLWERLVTSDDDGCRRVSEEEAVRVLAIWPGLAALVGRVREAVRQENGDASTEAACPTH